MKRKLLVRSLYRSTFRSFQCLCLCVLQYFTTRRVTKPLEQTHPATLYRVVTRFGRSGFSFSCRTYALSICLIRFAPLQREKPNGPPINKVAGSDVVQMSSSAPTRLIPWTCIEDTGGEELVEMAFPTPVALYRLFAKGLRRWRANRPTYQQSCRVLSFRCRPDVVLMSFNMAESMALWRKWERRRFVRSGLPTPVRCLHPYPGTKVTKLSGATKI